MLAFSRIPGNAFSFWVRQTLRWSRGRPILPHEPKEDLFAYLGAEEAPAGGAPGGGTPGGEARERELRNRYDLTPLARASTRALYRKNLYLLDILEKACEGLPIPEGSPPAGSIRALDVGSQDWHYVFALERWLRHGTGSRDGRTGAAGKTERPVFLKGVEVDGYGIYPDFRSRRDYAQAYLAQTENPEVVFEVGDFLKTGGGGYDLLTLFYPFVTRHHLLLWGLPLRFFQPGKLLEKAAALTRPGGWMLVFTHTLKEHDLFLDLGKRAGGYALVREGRALSRLVDFHEDVADRRFSVWRRI
ncbi:MAG TPA: hypothetical protein VJ385_08015 [Fibrobacteria bacterium]|nr:hypothetical protein [Fibrobacteria bacterium]